MKKDKFPTEKLEVRVSRLNEKGIGEADYYHPPKKAGQEGKKLSLYLPHTYPGDLVEVTVPNAKGRKRAQLNYDRILEAGPSRIGQADPKLPRSGGSPLEYMDYSAQLAWKQALVEGYIEDQGFDPGLVRPILGMDHPFQYRNKMDLTFGSDGSLGMHQQGNFRKVVDLKESAIAPQIFVDIAELIRNWQADHGLKGYDKGSRQGLLRHLLLRKSFATGEIMVALYATEAADAYPQPSGDLVKRLEAGVEGLVSLSWQENQDIADSVQSQAGQVLLGRDYIYDELYGFRYRIWPDTFFQPNPIQAEKMVQTALDLAEVTEDMRVLDLFCGVGTFSLPFAAQAKELAGIEIVESSIESAKRNAKDNGLDNTYFIARDARKGMTELEETWGRPDLVLLDPPRSGAGGKVMRRIGRLQTEKVVYVSCNPKTLAEDLVWLRNFGYSLKVVQPIDQFPHTPHTEAIVLMSKD